MTDNNQQRDPKIITKNIKIEKFYNLNFQNIARAKSENVFYVRLVKTKDGIFDSCQSSSVVGGCVDLILWQPQWSITRVLKLTSD